MNFTPHTQEQLQSMNIQQDKKYKIQYINKDYFNGDETLETTTATAIINDSNIVFVVPDPYGMDRFIDKVKIL